MYVDSALVDGDVNDDLRTIEKVIDVVCEGSVLGEEVGGTKKRKRGDEPFACEPFACAQSDESRLEVSCDLMRFLMDPPRPRHKKVDACGRETPLGAITSLTTDSAVIDGGAVDLWESKELLKWLCYIRTFRPSSSMKLHYGPLGPNGGYPDVFLLDDMEATGTALMYVRGQLTVFLHGKPAGFYHGQDGALIWHRVVRVYRYVQIAMRRCKFAYQLRPKILAFMSSGSVSRLDGSVSRLDVLEYLKSNENLSPDPNVGVADGIKQALALGVHRGEVVEQQGGYYNLARA